MRSSILGVGTELTDGQIINKNASWLAQKLKPLGLRTTWHLAVPDEREKILRALHLCEGESDVIFVTGGLGPTSDDFTRDLISEWSGRPLVFHEESWRMVQERLTSRGYVVHDFQRQQCFFPESALVLKNPQGTANGFRLSAKGKEVIVLPGPPREIEAIWNEELGAWLEKLAKDIDPMETKAWQLIGLGESQVAAMMEPVVAGHDVEVGYRIHLPYVEFKIGYPRSRKPTALLEAAEKTLSPWVLAHDDEDVAVALAKAIPATEDFCVVDEVTGSFLFQRFGNAFFREKSPAARFLQNRPSAFEGRVFSLSPEGDFGIRVRLEGGGKREEEVLEAPMKAAALQERRLQYFAEVAMAWCLRKLTAEPGKPPSISRGSGKG